MSKIQRTPDLFTRFFESFGRNYMPEWVENALNESYKFFDGVGEDHIPTSVSFPFTNMEMQGLEAFILFGVRYIEDWQFNKRCLGNNRGLQAEIIINTKSRTKIVTHYYNVLNIRLFNDHVDEFGAFCRYYFNAGKLLNFDDMLNEFVRLLCNENLQVSGWTIDEEITNSLFESLKSSLGSSSSGGVTGYFEEHLFEGVFSSEEHTDWFDEEVGILDDSFLSKDIGCDYVQESSAPKPESKAPIFVKLSEALESDAPDVKQLFEQLIFMIISKGFQTNGFTKFPSLIEIKKDNSKLPKIDKSLLLASVYGSPNVMQKISSQMGIPVRQIRFPGHVIRARQALREVPMIKKSFHHEGVEATFFHHALSFKCEAQIDLNISSELNKLFIQEASNAPITINYPSLVECLIEYQQPFNAQFARKKSQLLKSFLTEKVIGQKFAIDSAADLYYGAIHPNQSLSDIKVESLTLLGASQSGKSLLADSFTKALNSIDEGVGYDSLFIPMESYSDSKSIMKLIGTGSQYVDSALGDLTLTAELNPRTCFVFENFDKAHSVVQEALLTLLDSGELPDNTSNRVVNFEQCFFLFTTSVGSSQISALNQ